MQAKILPSRQALVDRIELQYEYGQPIICLLGQSGIGKSYLLESFVSEKYQNHTKSYVQLTAKMTDISVMNSVLEQCFSSPLIDQTLSFSENFNELFQHRDAQYLLIVLDNVQHSSDLLLNEFELVAKQHSQYVKFLLAANKPVPIASATHIHLEPISPDESRQFLAMYYDELPHRYDPVFISFLDSANGNPTLLLAWQDFQSKQTEAASSSKKHVYVIAISILLIFLLVISASFYVLVLKNQKPVLLEAEEQTLNPVPLVLSTDKFSEITTSAGLVDEKKPESINASVSDVNELLQLNTERLSNKQEPFTSTLPENKNSTQAILNELMANKLQLVEEPNIEKEFSSDYKPEKAIELSTPVVTVAYDNQWFVEQSQQLVMLQLIAVSDEETLQQFLMNHTLNQVRIYQTQRNNAPWWVVTIGPYQNITQSQEAKQQLEASLLELAPFSKTIKTIQAEIARLQPN